MKPALHPTDHAGLRVLLVTSISGASLALAGWLRHQDGLHVCGPLPRTDRLGAQAAKYQPQVVIIDADGLATSLITCIAQLKGLTPPPIVIALACDASTTLRRRCRAAGVDAVFAKMTELDGLASRLASLCPPAAAPTPLSAP